MTAKTDEDFMKCALREAEKAAAHDEVPVGAVIVYDGKVIARAHNRRITDSDGTAHAEILCIRKAGRKLGVWNLTGCTLYVTLEPCPMCAGAAVQSRIDRIVYGADDMRFGACGSALNIADSGKTNHRIELRGGVRSEECSALLSGFFKAKRR